MKILQAFLIIFFFSNLVIGQVKIGMHDSTITNLNHKVQVLENKVNQLEDSLENKSFLSDLLVSQLKYKNQILEERINQASDTISNQNSLFDGFGILYSIITIIIAIIGIVLPILTYQFGIKPSQKALENFENNAETKIEDFLEKSRNRQIEQAIHNISSDNQELKSNAVTYLSLTQYQGFSDEQLFKLLTLLKSDKIDQVTKGILAYAISNRKSDYANEYFKEEIFTPDNSNIKYAAIRYFANTGIENYLNTIRKLVYSSSDKTSEFNSLLIHMASINKEAVKVLINDKKLIDYFDEKDIELQKQTLNKDLLQISEKEFEKSYLFKKLNNK